MNIYLEIAFNGSGDYSSVSNQIWQEYNLETEGQSSLKLHLIVYCVTLAVHFASSGQTKNSYTAESSM